MRLRIQALVSTLVVILIAALLWVWPLARVSCQVVDGSACPEEVQQKLAGVKRSFWWVSVNELERDVVTPAGYSLLRWQKSFPGTLHLAISLPTFAYNLATPDQNLHPVTNEGVYFGQLAAVADHPVITLGFSPFAADGSLATTVNSFARAIATALQQHDLKPTQVLLKDEQHAEITFLVGEKKAVATIDSSQPQLQVAKIKAIAANAEQFLELEEPIEIDMRFRLPVVKNAVEVEELQVEQKQASPAATASKSATNQ